MSPEFGNLYVYVGEAPTMYADESGLCPYDPRKPQCGTVNMLVTGYDNSFQSTGKNPGDPGYGITASGQVAGSGTIAAPRTYPFGTSMQVPGYGSGTVQDRGGAIRGNHIDVWFPTKK